MDVAFRLVLDGIDGIVARETDELGRQELALVIADDRETEKPTRRNCEGRTDSSEPFHGHRIGRLAGARICWMTYFW